MPRYTLSSLKKAVRDPSLAVEEIDQALCQVRSWKFEAQHGPGIDMMEEDWDVLILLDACRYDYFKNQVNIRGELERVISPGARSWEFMQQTFAGRELHDTVYVTANPHTEKLDSNIFYTVETMLDSWNQDLGTVLPEDVVSAAIEANANYPNKRLIIHFMQPHKPHLGPTSEQIRQRVELKGWDKYHGHSDKKAERDGISLWKAVEENKVTIDELRKAYSQSLDIVLEEVEELIKSIPGKTIISADHGEMLGERGAITRQFGHPKMYTPELRVVPWFLVQPTDSRRDVEPEEPIGYERLDDEVVENRLAALGYTAE